MTIIEYADAINRELEITYYPNQANRFSAQFDGAEIKEDAILCSAFGDGVTPDKALREYAIMIQGKTIVFNASMENRMEFRVPNNVTWGPA